ncbi:polymer-forming cytoskeletal protein [Geobacillus subterraneus]|uniref:polymer-forming cytoskeletal protein n=1 Tax=Geobacillus subterraneus TaxID=129338 RepID=UPI0016166414
MERRDLVIAGSGHASGGLYNLVKLSGNGKLYGDLDCLEIQVQGNAAIEGSVKANTVHIAGKGHVAGGIECEWMKVSGSVKIGGDVKCQEATVRGRGLVKGSCAAEKVRVHGELDVGGDCSAERMEVEGHFTVGGLLNADYVEVKLLGPSRAKEMGGETIMVKRQGSSLFKKWFFPAELTADVIEGDEIHLEYTTANTVRGNRVTIGPGCRIERVEYREALECDEEAKIGTIEKG